MIRNVLNTLGSFRSTVKVLAGLPILAAASAFAQAPATEAAPDASVREATAERVMVTGSWIPTAETESALPVTVYTAEVLTKQGAQQPVELPFPVPLRPQARLPEYRPTWSTMSSR